jgi:hypothetical protein
MYRNFIYNRLPEIEPTGSKHEEDIKKIKNINIGNLHFVCLYYYTFGIGPLHTVDSLGLCNCGGTGVTPNQSMWGLWCTK